MGQQARKLGIVATLVVVLSTFGCTFIRPPAPLHEVNAPFTIRPIGMDSTAFVRAADDMLERKAPRWRNHGAQVHLGFGLLSKYGVTAKDAEGNLYIVLGRPALVMATVEDLAAVLLHEYVHVVYWDYVFDNPSFEDATYECKRCRAEMLANKVVVEMYHRIGYRHDMMRHQLALYQSAYVYQQVMGCPPEIALDLPKFVRPLKFKGRNPIIPELEQPDYVPEDNRDGHLDPWDDPNKTDPLYPYSRPKSSVVPSNAK